MTSHDAVARIRRLTGISRVGHGGTLDPAAAGILPIALGSFTRLLPYIEFSPKIYRAEVAAGAVTHSGDAEGRVTAISPDRRWRVAQLHQAARWLTGDVWQVPPQVSALKGQGTRHYQTVLKGGVVWPSPRRVQVAAIDEIAVTEHGWSFRAQVSAGTYVRALVRDWGYLLGSAAHLCGLERIQAGRLTQDTSVTLAQLEQNPESWREHTIPWRRFLEFSALSLTADEAVRAHHGDLRALGRLDGFEPGRAALIEEDRLIGVAEGPPWRYGLVLGEGR